MSAETAARPLSQLRIEVWVARSFAAEAALIFAGQGAYFLAIALQRAGLPYADLGDYEGALFVQLQRMGNGAAAYLSTFDANSFVFGPFYLHLMAALNALEGGRPNVVSGRLLGMALGLSGLVPLSFSAILIARRMTGRLAMRWSAPMAGVLCASLGLAVLTRRRTFGSLHPDDLVFALVATMLLCYNAAGVSVRNGRLTALLGVAGVAACFSEEPIGALAPALFLGLALTRSITLRTLNLLFAAYGCAIAGSLLALGNEGRAWAFLVPLAHPWSAPAQTCTGQFSTCVQPHSVLLFCAAALASRLLWQQERLRTLAADALPILAIMATARAGSLSRDAIGDSLFLAGIACVPYFAATFAALVAPRMLARDRGAAVLAIVLALATGFALNVQPPQVPDTLVTSTLVDAGAAASAICARRREIVVLALPDLFRDCPKASYRLSVSYGQIADAFPRYNGGPSAFQLPQQSTYLVTIAGVLLPASWYFDYRLESTSPVLIGYGDRFVAAALQIYKHR
jgi:hypothetical protein